MRINIKNVACDMSALVRQKFYAITAGQIDIQPGAGK